MRRLSLFLTLLFALGCVPKGYVHAEKIDGLVQKVTTRHDAYVDADPELSPEKKSSYKTSSLLLNKILEEALEREENSAEEEPAQGPPHDQFCVCETCLEPYQVSQ